MHNRKDPFDFRLKKIEVSVGDLDDLMNPLA